MVDTGALVIAAIMALGNIGGVVVLLKKYTAAVDKHNETLPILTAALEQVSKSLSKTGDHLDQLFRAKDDHETRIQRIETVHDIRGCNSPIDPLWKTPLLQRKDPPSP